MAVLFQKNITPFFSTHLRAGLHRWRESRNFADKHRLDMKKAIIKLFVLLLCAMPEIACAQFVNHAPAKKFVEVDAHVFGGTTGITQNYASKFSEITECNADNGTGYGLGAGAVFGLRQWFGFGTEANILVGHNKVNMAVSNHENVSMSNIFVRNRYTYINFPVFLSFRFNILDGMRWNVDVGLYYSYGIWGKQKQTIYNSTLNDLGQLVPRTVVTNCSYFNSSSTFINSYRRNDIGLHLATALQFGNHFFIGARCQIGFKNVSFNSGLVNPNIHNFNFMGSAGYKF